MKTNLQKLKINRMDFMQKFAHLFFPKASNNHKAKILHPSGLTVLILIYLLYQLVLTVLPRFSQSVLGYASNIPPSEVIKLTNEKRVKNGLSPLTESTVLDQAAQAKGADMLNKGYWAHVAPDGTQPWKFFSDFGYNYRYAGENLARDFSNAASAVDAWMNSPSHRENLLSPKYQDIGIAVVEGKLAGVDTTIIVQFFGNRYADTVPAVPVAKAETVAAAELPTIATPQPTTRVVVGTPVPQTVAMISPFTTTKMVSLSLVGLLLVVLVIDGVVIYKKKITRVGGRTFAHIAFFGMILAIIIILRAGQVNLR